MTKIISTIRFRLALRATALVLIVCAFHTAFIANGHAVEFARTVAGVDENGELSPYASVVDAAGNTYVAGRFTRTATFGAITITAPASNIALGLWSGFVAKFAPDGTAVWARSFGSDTGQGTVGALALDVQQNLVIAGWGVARLRLSYSPIRPTHIWALLLQS